MGYTQSQRKWIKDNYKTITIRFINENGQTVGYKPYSVPIKQKTNDNELRWYVKNWNETHEFALEAVKAEVVEQKEEHTRAKAEQLTLF